MSNEESDERIEVADVVVEFRAEYAGRNDVAIDAVERQGLAVDSVDDADGVVTGSIHAERVAALQSLPCVADVRVVETYLSSVPSAPGPDRADPAAPEPPA